MDFEVWWHLGVDLLEEVEKLGRSVPLVALPTTNPVAMSRAANSEVVP
jgi:hypothetical protein